MKAVRSITLRYPEEVFQELEEAKKKSGGSWEKFVLGAVFGNAEVVNEEA